MQRETPQIDSRKFSDVLAQLQRTAPHYTPEWPATDEKDSGAALLKVFSHLAETIIKRLNQTPHKNFVAFLNMLGVKLLPGQPSRVPLHFKLAQGTSDEVFIPARTRATSDNPALPFETENDLRATPSALAQVVSIDPAKDAIYKPPRGFLERALPDQSQVRYRLIAFSRAGSNTLQLDHTDNLEKGDLLKLGSAEAANTNGACTCLANTSAENDEAAGVEYVTIEKINGTIVELTTKLKRDYSPDAPLAKITQFHVFESKNLQEHILFLGHKDLFNVKSLAQFTLAITHLSGTEGDIASLAIAWEYWGEEKDKEGSDWRSFKVEFDGSHGLSQSGELTLLKPTEGEIAEFEINGIKSRWIRARLQEPLPTTEARRLPVLDNIKFKVQSAGEALPPDQAFHNDTPLDFNLPFYPFGLEPRLFDKFQLASKEAFSKKGASITISVKVDSIGTIAAPGVVVDNENKMHVFTRGTLGRLIELIVDSVDPSKSEWRNHELPNSLEDSIALPSLKNQTEAAPHVLFSKKDANFFIFCSSENGNLLECTIKPVVEQEPEVTWKSHGRPSANAELQSDATAIFSDGNESVIKIFLITKQGDLCSFTRGQGINPSWELLGHPSEQTLFSSPFAVGTDKGVHRVFAQCGDGLLCELEDKTWKSYRAPNADPAQPYSPKFITSLKPFAKLYYDVNNVVHAKVLTKALVKDDAGKFTLGRLAELDTKAYSDSTGWSGLHEIATHEVASGPHGIIQQPEKEISIEGKRIFCRGAKNTLLEVRDDHQWVDYGSLPDVELRHSPFAVETRELFVYSGSNRNSILEKRNPTPDNGTAQVSTATYMTLDDNAPELKIDALPTKIEITGGKGAGQTRKIQSYAADQKVIQIDQRWQTALDSTSTYKIKRTVQQDIGLVGSISTIKLSEKASANQNLYQEHDIKIAAGKGAGQVRRLMAYDTRLNAVSVNTAWDSLEKVPDTSSDYEIDPAEQRTARGGSENSILLAADASHVNDSYKGLRIEITDHIGKGQIKEIVAYNGATQEATVDSDWDAGKFPDTTSVYKIANDAGTAQGGSAASITLASEASSQNERYTGFMINIVGGTGSNQERKIVQYIGATRTAIVETIWDVVPDNTSSYKIIAHTGQAQGGAQPKITLAAGSSPTDDTYTGFEITIVNGKGAGQKRRITKYEANTQEATVAEAWSVVPNDTSEYEINTQSTGTVTGSTAKTVILGSSASPDDDAYNDYTIEITAVTGKEQSRTIADYIGELRQVQVNESWDPRPDGTSEYIILNKEDELVNVGFIQSSTPSSIILDPASASDREDLYNTAKIEITTGAGAGQSRTITDYQTKDNVRKAIISPEWKTLPDGDSAYNIHPVRGTARGAKPPLIKLATTASKISEHYKDFIVMITAGPGADQRRKITSYKADTKEAEVEAVWSETQVPTKDSFYEIIAHEGTAQKGLAAHIILAQAASSRKDFYVGFMITITGNTGAGQTRTIKSYNEVSKEAAVDQAWDAIPDNTSIYKIVPVAEKARGGTFSTITFLGATLDDYTGMEIEIKSGPADKEKRTISSYDPNTRTAVITPAWNSPAVPNKDSAFDIKSTITMGTARVGTANTLMLEATAPSAAGFFKEWEIKITEGRGIGQERKVIEYRGESRLVIVDKAWEIRPDSSSKYLLSNQRTSIWEEYNDPDERKIVPELSWEYWNSKGWVVLQQDEHKFEDKTRNLLFDNVIRFLLPDDIELTEIAGQENYWIRARLVAGDFGAPTFTLEEQVKGLPDKVIKETKLLPDKKTLRPPRIISLAIDYDLTSLRFPQLCLTYNNLDYLDQTGACTTTDKRFPPFVRLEEQDLEEACVIETIPANGNGEPVRVAAPAALGKALYLGFQEKINGEPIKIFFAAKELPYSDPTKPKMEWSYRAENEWKRLSFDDDTEGLIKQEILQFIAPRDLTQATRFGASQHWVRGMLVEGNYEATPELSGIYPNTTWAFQAETILDEALGSGTGEAHQTFRLFKFPVRESEIVRVQEVLTEEEKEALKQSLGESALHEVKDELGKVLETWVRWQEVENFFKSSRVDRHYTLDRATGELRFGDGRNGQIPPAGLNNIRVFSYQAGGGSQGNVAAGAIQSVVTAIANVDAVLNPVAAGAGSDTATLDEMLEHGPAMISHRQRAVTPGDFEWLARQASRLIAKARCVRNLNLKRNEEIGWATVYIVPDSTEPEPQPSLELRRTVREVLEAHCANTIAAEHHVFVEGPTYMKINVAADIFVKSIDLAAAVEQSARKKLEEFFHPLTGGPRERGWEFGEDVAASDVYALLEEIEGVDHLERLGFSVNDVAYSDVVEIAPHALVAPGAPSLNVIAISEM